MPNYSNTPPVDGRGPAYAIRRTPAARALIAVITSDDLLGCATHFYGGRTVPCEAPDCAACLDQIPWRWHGYVAAIDVATYEHFIFEMTAQATDALVAYRAKHGTLKGCKIEATRAHNRANGRVRLRCKPADLQQMSLPPAPDIARALNILWNITTHNEVLRPKPGSCPEETDDGNNRPTRDPVQLMTEIPYAGNSPAKQPDIH